MAAILPHRAGGRVGNSSHHGQVKAVIATSAFGMGLDIPDIRLVVHWQHPSGRAFPGML
jgi:superfamily II DNA helicase RecQ